MILYNQVSKTTNSFIKSGDVKLKKNQKPFPKITTRLIKEHCIAINKDSLYLYLLRSHYEGAEMYKKYINGTNQDGEIKINVDVGKLYNGHLNSLEKLLKKKKNF